MANWYGTARSNYFRVKEEGEFLKWADGRGLGVFKNEESRDLFAIHGGSTEDGSWPSYDMEADIEFDLVAELAQHLSKGQIAVLVEIGAEKLRYLTGMAIAVNPKGRVVELTLSDIYSKASRAFRIAESEITQATYWFGRIGWTINRIKERARVLCLLPDHESCPGRHPPGETFAWGPRLSPRYVVKTTMHAVGSGSKRLKRR
jgi:hypothetical protein